MLLPDGECSHLLLVDGECWVWGVGCGRVAARLTSGAQAAGLGPGDMMTVGCSPARGGAAAQSDWAVRGAGASVARWRRDKCVPGAGRKGYPIG
jgi:hypothetical protein